MAATRWSRLRALASLLSWAGATWIATVLAGIIRLEQIGTSVGSVVVGLLAAAVCAAPLYLAFVLLAPIASWRALAIAVMSLAGADLVAHMRIEQDEIAAMVAAEHCTAGDVEHARPWPYGDARFGCASGRAFATD
ncbi:MAG: hypothetical protein U0168_25740 [Nannocystaceae bacterium]